MDDKKSAGTPAGLLDVLCNELDELSGRERSHRCGSLQELFAHLGQQKDAGLAALCLSGGGIRSATFNLGILQQLARLGLMKQFDYLSSVSGGGYIASWLRTWMFRVGTDEVIEQLRHRPDDPLKPEPKPISLLRTYSNFLTPRLGLFSGDTWAAAAIIVRNLVLNWLVIVPLLAGIIGMPQLFLLVAKGKSAQAPLYTCHALLCVALVIELFASLLVYRYRRLSKYPPPEWRHHPPSQTRFLLACALPICIAAAVLATAGLYVDIDLTAGEWRLWGFSALWCIVVPILGWLCNLIFAPRRSDRSGESDCGERLPDVAQARRSSWRYELFALVISGLVATVLLTAVTTYWYTGLRAMPGYYVILVLPILLGIYLIARMLFVGISSLSEGFCNRVKVSASDDNDHEWWARLSGWILLVIVSWTGVTLICLLGGHLLDYLASMAHSEGDGALCAWPLQLVHWAVAALGGASGITAARLSYTDTSSAGAGSRSAADSLTHKIVLAIAAPLFVICLIMLLSWGTGAVGTWLINLFGGNDERVFSFCGDFCGMYTVVSFADMGVFAAMLALLVVFSFLAGYAVNVNRYSLHGMYRNRLVRAYLGASNLDRSPDPFTGFSWRDNPKLHELWKTNGDKPATRPLPIINTAVNLVQGEQLAWQQRKAASFAMTPFHCGSVMLGYRRTDRYGGPGGISVGTAITISGAAANPNMGYNSSPVLAFLMTLFNVRLGSWLGNTNPHGREAYKWAGPRQALMPLLSEMLGMTSDQHPYVNLSDGGHFDNLGLYEVVLRRCRRIVVCDAGRDTENGGSFGFEDLGNAIRKVRIDFGIRIEFQKKIVIQPNGATQPGSYCAIARICYSDVDDSDPDNDGYLLYLKPTLHGQGVGVPYDVYSYSRESKDFPHETTADQWFSESQFESYRALGSHSLQQIAAQGTVVTLDDLFIAARRYAEKYETSPPAAAA
jgi:hypothetical protein